MSQPQLSVLGNLRIAGALIMDQNNTTFPTPAKQGMLVIKDLDLYAYLTIGGVQVWYPVVQQQLSAATYVHTQSTPSNLWTVHHNLNTPLSNIWYQVQDISNEIVGPASVTEINNNSFTIAFTTPIVGTCIMVGTEQVILDNAIIGDGTATKINHYANQRLDFIAGSGISIAFDDSAKSITINGGALQSAITALAAATDTTTTNVLPLTYGDITTNLLNTTSLAVNQVIDSFDIAVYRSAKYMVQISSATAFQVAEIMCIQDGTTPFVSEISDVCTGNSFLATFSASIVNGIFNLLVSPSAVGLSIKVVRNSISI